MTSGRPFLPRFVAGLVIFLVVSAIWLYAFPGPYLAYVVVVLLHSGIGALATVLLFPRIVRAWRSEVLISRGGWLLLLVAAVLGVVLFLTGTPRS
ncbi:MAG TPA: hypothetical protein VFP40_16875, partial [Terriglobales bacterium]|nr:hypothetical protein [Terriglobales bacterium]